MVLLNSLYTDCTRKVYSRSFGVTRSNTKTKFYTTSNGKINNANMLALVKHAKVPTVTFSFDLRFRGRRSKKVKFQTMSNGKTNDANMLALVKHAKVSTVSSLSDLQFRGKRSNIKQYQMAKLTVPTC